MTFSYASPLVEFIIKLISELLLFMCMIQKLFLSLLWILMSLTTFTSFTFKSFLEKNFRKKSDIFSFPAKKEMSPSLIWMYRYKYFWKRDTIHSIKWMCRNHWNIKNYSVSDVCTNCKQSSWMVYGVNITWFNERNLENPYNSTVYYCIKLDIYIYFLYAVHKNSTPKATL